MIQVKPVGKWRIYIILYFYEGKLVDIVRHKEHQGEKESDEIIFDLQREFGTLYEQKVSDGLLFTSFSKGGGPRSGGGFKKSGEAISGQLKTLFDSLFQSYIINSSFDESNLMNDLLSTLQKRY